MRRLAALVLVVGCASNAPESRIPPAPSSAPTATATLAPAKGAPVVVALVVDQLAAWEAAERFDDLRHGWVEQRPFEQCGDLLVRDRDGCWTYQFAVAVDDMEQRVNLVVRGDDLLASAGRQIQLARLLGRSRPATFLHHALIMKSPTQKLSKADGDTSVRDLRHAGWSAAMVIGKAAELGGLTDGCRPLRVDDVTSIVGERYQRIAKLLNC